MRAAAVLIMLAALAGCGESSPPPGEPISAEDFRRELVGMPLCGKPNSGPFAGRLMCTVHLADGTAILAGGGVLARGLWDVSGRRICRRDAIETPDKRRCVDYERLPGNRYRNSDGVVFCIGPCP